MAMNFTGYSPYTQPAAYGNPYPTYTTPQTQQVTNAVNMVLVNSEDDARNFPLNPGSSIFLMDSGNCFFYTKSVDFSGISTFKKYKFTEVTENQAPPADYITREEFEAYKESLRSQNRSYKKERIDNESTRSNVRKKSYSQSAPADYSDGYDATV